MPFDPNTPATNAELDSPMFRAQFNGLKDLIDAAPGITGVIVDGVNTLNPGDPATVNLSLVGTELHFGFGIPKGLDGVSSLPVTSFAVDSVMTLNPGEAATASAMFNGSTVLINFGIPRGDQGSTGGTGSTGDTGSQGPPGEVSNAALVAAINDTSKVSNGVATLDIAFANDPPSLADMELVRAKMNELITALRR